MSGPEPAADSPQGAGLERRPLALVVAMGRDRVIGKDGGLPWRIPEDLKHFKRVTMGHALVMGRRTFESIGKPLPGRRNIVVSRRGFDAPEGVEVVGDLETALALAREADDTPMVIGGAQVYAAALPQATQIHLTEVDRPVEGDTFFPGLDDADWEEVEARPGETEDVTFKVLARRPG